MEIIELINHLSFVYTVFAFIAVRYFKLNILLLFIIGLSVQVLIIKGIL